MSKRPTTTATITTTSQVVANNASPRLHRRATTKQRSPYFGPLSSDGNYFYYRNPLSSKGNMTLAPGSNRSRSRLTSPRQRAGVPPLKPLKNVQNFDARERMLLEAAERGDKATIQACFNAQGDAKVNVNCTDLLGRTGIEIAVDNENAEIVELFLKQDGIKIGNALLYAIREGVYRIVEMMINHPSITPEMLGDGWAHSRKAEEDAENFEYSSDTSPVILAAHLNQFEILQLLLSRGATIQRPHSLDCTCPECNEQRLNDSLHHSLRRIHTYRALASPAWISLTSSDPILTAFKLSWELQKLSVKENEFKDVYLELSDQSKTFACDLLSQCRSSEEVIAVLNKDCSSDDPDDIWGSKLSLARLKLAIKYMQKQFVAHPHCQQLLTSIWYEGFPGRQERGSALNILVCLLLILCWPFLALIYIVCPQSRIGQIVRSPFMKFLYFSTSFGSFLILLTMATFEDYRQNRHNSQKPRADERGPLPTAIELLIFIWVLGMIWAEVKQLWDEGFKKYIHQWWNWLDFIMMSLYLCTFALRAVAIYIFQFNSGDNDITHVSRIFWQADEPVLISESLFAVANIFSFARIIYLFQTNPYLGPLQISLGCMLIDIAKFFFIFFLVLSSFAIGMHQLYWYYDPKYATCTTTGAETAEQTVLTDVDCRGNPSAFISIANSYATLIWSLFSITDVKHTEVIEHHDFTELIGRGMYIAYHVTSIIVLLNMLIAMMSHSFQIINDHADMEWKFHRSKLWMSYFDEGSSLPAPFNIIITPKSIYYCIRAVKDMLCGFWGKRPWQSRVKRATIRRPGYNQAKWQKREHSENAENDEMKNEDHSGSGEPEQVVSYQQKEQDIMRRLVSRYIHLTKKEMKMDGVNEDDLLEIKQDISSLRYELREDRRREIMRSSKEIEGVKKEIIRTLSVSSSPQPPMFKVHPDLQCVAEIESDANSSCSQPVETGSENTIAASTDAADELDIASPERQASSRGPFSICRSLRWKLPQNLEQRISDSCELLPSPSTISEASFHQQQRTTESCPVSSSSAVFAATASASCHCSCCLTETTKQELKHELVAAIRAEMNTILTSQQHNQQTLRFSGANSSLQRSASPRYQTRPFLANEENQGYFTATTIPPLLLGNGELYETKLYTEL